MFDRISPVDYINSTSTTATGDSIYVDGSSVSHPPSLSIDDTIPTWFGSNSAGSAASLELDVGALGPYYDAMKNISVYNRRVPFAAVCTSSSERLQGGGGGAHLAVLPALDCSWWRCGPCLRKAQRVCIGMRAGWTAARTGCSALVWSCTASRTCSWRRSASAGRTPRCTSSSSSCRPRRQSRRPGGRGW
jgi:hypothetical protein